ncbi:MerR family transcriptional regulator [Bacillus aquiflavi]|uniref:MerR family transcriptional regulator n=1 Tax=Bacillus aquiflavi TaxID=2672567 RepID=A0A6B3VX52_9BACI|nr:MerR family transcriptional regulator [Bacillus aquiflavi]MBA4535745.1 MerR family transcriptional regulator [Bacillus aquiflavi]NEY80121.1 MerR family transcriptional regulator [Bacillus aquiflavi]UAC47988.1 MerR family transcriptional regulator [Bacillus aquiflavi]
MEKRFSIGEFAKITNVTTRTLQYYDEVGLLTASRTKSGHRTYKEHDFITLQKITSLKFLGYSLDQIKEFIQQDQWDIVDYFAFQQEEMIKKRDHFNCVIRLLDYAQKMIKRTGNLDANIFVSLINSIQMEEEQKQWLKRYIPDEEVESFFQLAREKQTKIEEEYISIMSQLRNSDLSNPEHQTVQHLVGKLFSLAKEIIGESVSVFDYLKEIDIKEEKWTLGPAIFSKEEEQLLQKAFQIYLKTEGIHIHDPKRK